MKNIILFLIIISFSSCSNKKPDVLHIKNQKYCVLVDSIMTTLPGKILYQEGILYWYSAFTTDFFVHVVDINKNEICSFGKIGDGPEEFVSPVFSLSPKSGLFINDAQKNLEILYHVNKSDSIVTREIGKYDVIKDATAIIRITNDIIIYLCPFNDAPFCIKTKNKKINCGKTPLNEGISNGFEMYQGDIAYNSNNNFFVYNTLMFPYTAVYILEDDKLVLKNELRMDEQYSICEGRLLLEDNFPHGAKEMALSKNYIVFIQRDEEIEGKMPRPSKAYDTSVLPHSLYVYDYDLNLVKIINMPFPSIRLCGDINSDVIYGIGVNPEYMIYSADLR